ncbi:class A beta-lactamase [Uliginosibacterium gangwonense]|uniref:class A beta-lactamase n=1 Tax=Uliginosibacterium gangwonense TaxID=392736 RepID=UPI0003A1CDC2|nr:class A beta-lactamase [Uliginosibacterium gangwonense]
MDRRNFMHFGCAALCTLSYPVLAKNFQASQTKLAALEGETGGRLGIACIDTATGKAFGYRADERFPMCSTFKWLAGAALLKQVDEKTKRLDQRIRFSHKQLLGGSPVTQKFADTEGMSLAALCEAAIADSDNTAANLIVETLGGIPAWNAYVRTLGDQLTHLDHPEPFLNKTQMGDKRNTTTPSAMCANLKHVLLEDALSPSSREQLKQWMLATRTGKQRLRKDLNSGWTLANKTGTGDAETGTANDIGIYWPPTGQPIVLTVYLTHAHVPLAQQEAAIAQVGHWVRDGWRA